MKTPICFPARGMAEILPFRESNNLIVFGFGCIEIPPWANCLLSATLNAISASVPEPAPESSRHTASEQRAPVGGQCRASRNIPAARLPCDSNVFWKCLECGAVYEASQAPLRCPTCGNPQACFDLFAYRSHIPNISKSNIR